MENNQSPGNVSRDEQIGFHKGALKTLAAERQELSKILQIVEQLMHMHINGLKELGIDLATEANNQNQAPAQQNNNSGDALDSLINK